MWKSQLGTASQLQAKTDDDWDTDPDYVNNVSEKDQRWGAKHIAGSGHQASVDLKKLREEVRSDDTSIKKKLADDQNTGYGYGGKYGVETDRMDKSAKGADYHEPKAQHTSQIDNKQGFGGKYGKDERVDKSAVGWDYKADVQKHQSQKDYKTGFGGDFGVQTDRQDKSAVGWDYKAAKEQHDSQKDYKTGFGGQFGVQTTAQDQSALGWDHQEKKAVHSSQKDYASGFGGKHGVQEQTDKSAVGWDYKASKESHASQKDYKTGFGGEFGVQKDRQDASAVGWDHHTKAEAHESQKDYKTGFGGQFGVQQDRQDQSAVGFDYKSPTEAHESQKDYKTGFGGKFGVQKDRQDKSALGWDDDRTTAAVPSEKPKIENGAAKASSLRAKFESMAVDEAQEARKRTDAERIRRKALEEQEKAADKATEAERQKKLAEQEEERERLGGGAAAADPEHEEEEEIKPRPKQAFRYDAPAATAPPVRPPVRSPSVEEVAAGRAATPTTDLDDVPRIRDLKKEVEDHSRHYQNNLPPDSPEALYEELPVEGGRGATAVALFDYQAGDEDELSFEPDDVIENVEMVDEGWWRGELHGKNGLFPANYVELRK
ncbi:Src substrate protein p85 [Hypsibius exemplaris]|uniref:Src substrate protein p85 n=1 Tax=Hypsibius exemplaris TaxID=2072580 RepID=A0A1W0WEL9_HYPEX|nr:Src substrate protein p85 [Hypsibius exemplaris]